MWQLNPNLRYDNIFEQQSPCLLDVDRPSFRDALAIKKVVPRMEVVECEVERLKVLSAGKDCEDFWPLTRLEPVPKVESPQGEGGRSSWP